MVNLKIQQSSNDTYLKANKLKSDLISDSDVLENTFGLNLYSNDLSINTEVTVYENLNKENSDRFEYILPKFNLVKKIENKTNFNGDFSFKSQGIMRNYDTNIYEKININDFIFNSSPKITKNGFYNNFEFIFKNSNTDTQKSSNFKEGENYYVSSLFQFNTSLPLIKENENYQNILKPKMSIKIAPNNSKNLSDRYSRIDVNNIYSLNRISEDDVIEGGVSVAYGNDFSIFDKKDSKEIFNLKLANNLRIKENDDLPQNNQIGQKTSNFFSEILYSPNNIITATYNTSIKNNLSDINYENLITEFRLNNIVTTFDYLNENDSTDKNSYLKNTTKLIIDDFNSLSFSTRENKKLNLTEYYNLIYQYRNDCLAASVEYNKDFYSDRDLKPEENIFFKLTIIPFGETSSPNLNN
jgi:LPS-assembly protein